MKTFGSKHSLVITMHMYTSLVVILVKPFHHVGLADKC